MGGRIGDPVVRKLWERVWDIFEESFTRAYPTEAPHVARMLARGETTPATIEERMAIRLFNLHLIAEWGFALPSQAPTPQVQKKAARWLERLESQNPS